MSNIFFRMSVRAKIIVTMCVILLAATSLTTSFASNFLVKEFSNALQAEAVSIGRGLQLQLEKLIGLGLRLEDIAGFDKQCREVVEEYDDIAYATVLSRDGQVLFRSSDSLTPQYEDERLKKVVSEKKIVTTNVDFDGKRFLSVVVPVYEKHERVIGVISLGYPKDIIANKTNNLVFASIGISFTLLVLAGIFSYLAFSIWIINPLGKLLSAITKTSLEQATLRKVEVESQDEIGQLAMAYNDMVVRLNDNSVMLHDYQKELEKNVAELAAANRLLTTEVVERKQAEDAQKKALDELKIMQSQLIQSAKLASIGELAAGTAHELNQPLMVVRTTTQFLQRNFSRIKNSEDELSKNYDLILGATKRMMNVIDHLRYFSRQSRNEFDLLDINTVIENCFLLMGEQLRRYGVTVSKELCENLPPVYGDPLQLEQVFLNLIANARDALSSQNSDDSRHAASESKAKHLRIVSSLSQVNDTKIKVNITDNGPGIHERDLPLIFDPFFTTKEIGDGTGLGLSISYGILKEHHGAIQVKESGPHGTTFTVELPVASQERDEGS